MGPQGGGQGTPVIRPPPVDASKPAISVNGVNETQEEYEARMRREDPNYDRKVGLQQAWNVAAGNSAGNFGGVNTLTTHDPLAANTHAPPIAPGTVRVAVGGGNPMDRFLGAPGGPVAQTGPTTAVAPGMAGGMVGGKIDRGEDREIRGRQLEYLDALRNRMNGGTPSVAESDYNLKQGLVARQNLGMAAQARGGDALAARRAAILGNADQSGRQALGTALLRAKEQQDASDAMNSALFGVRGQDIGVNSRQGDMDQSTGETNFKELGTDRRFDEELKQRNDQGNADRSAHSDDVRYSSDRAYASQNDNKAPWWLGPAAGALGAIGGPIVGALAPGIAKSIYNSDSV